MSESVSKSDLKAGITTLNSSQFREAYAILSELAKSGDPEGQYYLGRLFESATYQVLNDPDFYDKHGWTCGKNKYSTNSFGNDSCMQDAAYWYEKSAEGGYVAAQEKIASLYSMGLGVHQDRAKGYHWYKLAAKQGSPISIMVLGLAYLNGDYAQKDVILAKSTIERAIAAGAKEGNYWLGYIYEKGIGVESNLEKAFDLYLLCTKETDSMLAPYRLGKMYESGKGVKKNLVEAVKWYEVARRYGMQTKQTGMLDLREKMNNRDWVLAIENAEKWLRENK
ncbi:tetratricopeptide repeat protein [Sneathiella sp.]|jgi:TPR repeat protein|uniref:tetratricopeptide repeat protein n=1 Tax=Sneathiella sp. TaxID=1964365 RepID=UPI0025F74F6D|nr:tetratricopeptide repeat protein [Sneathiella sp.]|tara:strand:- start:171 stop:1010 length:840 start_codon:yes stop_codon:yes gene_type:complete